MSRLSRGTEDLVRMRVVAVFFFFNSVLNYFGN